MASAAERKTKERKAKRDAGLVRVEVWVPKAAAQEAREQINKIARAYQENADR